MAGACGFVALSQDPLGFIFTLYVLFAATMVVALTDATTHLALAPDRATRAQESSAQLLAIFVASIYAYSALAKLQGDWLSGRTLLAIVVALVLHVTFELATHRDVMGFVMATLLLSAWCRPATATSE